jgi:enoyl-CoA hydratase
VSAAEVLVSREGAAGRLSLNRPKALHALTRAMCLEMSAALAAWAGDPAVQLVVIDHAEGRGFCAGGDINLLRNSALTDGGVAGRAFFLDEYRLNHQLFTYPKPVVALMDGITMGGGVGISQPARFRVATENTRFAMPESGIGLFPDVGGGWYLSRLKGRIGQYLALTGARLDGAECLWAGLATHWVPAAALPDAVARLAGGDDPAKVLRALSAVPPTPAIAEPAELIRRHFASDRLEDIIASLACDPGDWAQATLAALRTKSPLTCKVALRQLATGACLPDFAANMAMEYRIASRLMLLRDFAEGVRAVIVDKDNNPQWNPARPEDVSEMALDAIFAPLPAAKEWNPL